MPSGITSSERARVLLVDDNRMLLTRASALLSPTCDVVGTATTGVAAIDAASTLRPDVIVLDISMPGMTGFEVAYRLRECASEAAVVFLTVHDDEVLIAAAKAAGVLGYVAKTRLVTDLAFAVSEAREGRAFVSVSNPPHSLRSPA
jgi:DNA-binding NarL/FixJ family response regulator